MRHKRRLWLLTILSFVLFAGAVWGSFAGAAEKMPKVGPVKINPHPMSLEGKTVLLRWNGKMNGDKFLTRVAELLTQQVKNTKVIKLWEVDKSTAAISKNLEASEQVAATVAKLKPDLVIAMQAD
ncbi:MAG: hypothetical protein ACE144_04955 [Thermodesulfobacteriota bacterium]